MTAFKTLAIAIVIVLSIAHTKPSGAQFHGEEIIPLTTTRLNEIQNESPGDFAVNMLDVVYKKRDNGAGTKSFAIFDLDPTHVKANERNWHFTVWDRNTDQLYEYLAHESEYRALIQLCINAGLCEMQPISDPNFSYSDDHSIIEVRRGNEMARIGYNALTSESEAFFELVDYIEENFVAPALLNPVDKWWWKE